MSHSSLFPFDGTFERDSESLRKCLFISEDQLKILNDLTEWSCVEKSSDARLEQNSTLLDSQNFNTVSQLSQTNRKEIENRCLKNKHLFYKDLEYRREAFQTFKLKNRKHNRSLSFIQCLEAHSDISESVPLRRAFSCPAVNTISHNKRHINFPNSDKLIQLTLLVQSKDIFSDTMNVNLSPTVNPCCVEAAPKIMEVITHLPVNVASDEKECLTVHIRKPDKPISSNIASSPFGDLKDDKMLESEVSTSEGNHTEKVTKNALSDMCGNVADNLHNGKEGKKIAAQDVCEIQPKSIEGSSNPFLLLQNPNSPCANGVDTETIQDVVQEKGIVKQSGDMAKKSASQQVICSSPQGTKVYNNTQIIQNANGTIPNSAMIPPGYVAVKRKSDFRKNSKKHKQDKKGNVNERSVKKAEHITYSSEEINSMLFIIKMFLCN